jgi:hypothetical protein
MDFKIISSPQIGRGDNYNYCRYSAGKGVETRSLSSLHRPADERGSTAPSFASKISLTIKDKPWFAESLGHAE